jgi:hypothetical protein
VADQRAHQTLERDEVARGRFDVVGERDQCAAAQA